MRRTLRVGLILSVCPFLLVCGCQKRTATSSLLLKSESERVVTVVLDMSGSFAGRMAEGGEAYGFCMDVIDAYFADGIGSDDRLVIAQISGNASPLLWEGRPLDLRRKFPSAGEFRDFLHSRSSPDSSPVYQAMARVLKYVRSDSSVASGQAKSAMFVLSDMLDNGPPDSSRDAKEQLVEYAKQGGVIGMYFVHQDLVAAWRNELRSSGFKEYCVESEIVGRPSLPNFE